MGWTMMVATMLIMNMMMITIDVGVNAGNNYEYDDELMTMMMNLMINYEL